VRCPPARPACEHGTSPAAARGSPHASQSATGETGFHEDTAGPRLRPRGGGRLRPVRPSCRTCRPPSPRTRSHGPRSSVEPGKSKAVPPAGPRLREGGQGTVPSRRRRPGRAEQTGPGASSQDRLTPRLRPAPRKVADSDGKGPKPRPWQCGKHRTGNQQGEGRAIRQPGGTGRRISHELFHVKRKNGV
jgi:hypothetical protein